jgi:hypothetical protein
MKLVLDLYAAAHKANANGADEASVAAACKAAGGVTPALRDAFRAVLTDADLDGSFKVRCGGYVCFVAAVWWLGGGCVRSVCASLPFLLLFSSTIHPPL